MSTIRERLENLSAKQRQMLNEELKAITRQQSSVSDDPRSHRLVAYIVAKDGLSKSDLRSYLNEKMPDYMVPSGIVLLNELPRLPNGKIDLNALNEIHEAQEPEKTIEPEKELSPIQQKLVRIFEEVLGFSPVRVDDNFFEIGGDSILSIQITAKARNTGLTITPTQVFEYQTIADLAEVIEQKAEEITPDKEKSTLTDKDDSSSAFPDAGLSKDDLNKLMDQLD